MGEETKTFLGYWSFPFTFIRILKNVTYEILDEQFGLKSLSSTYLSIVSLKMNFSRRSINVQYWNSWRMDREYSICLEVVAGLYLCGHDKSGSMGERWATGSPIEKLYIYCAQNFCARFGFLDGGTMNYRATYRKTVYYWRPEAC